MKAVLANSLEPGRLIDLAHDLPPHEVREAAFLLSAMASGFPPGTVHVAVVDPGVGGRRAPIVIRCADGSLLVGPDNGVLTLLADRLGRPMGFRILPERLSSRERVGTTFDGRDVFAPAAALLANGMPPEQIGPRVTFQRTLLPDPRRRPDGARGEVLHTDRFGNLVTNVPTGWVPDDRSELLVIVGPRGRARRLPWVRSYEELKKGTLGALGSSFGLIEIAMARGSAARRLRAGPGSRIDLAWGQSPAHQDLPRTASME
jgi:S-adenosyl-L-methionine hydrolase (adenosine-forming)